MILTYNWKFIILQPNNSVARRHIRYQLSRHGGPPEAGLYAGLQLVTLLAALHPDGHTQHPGDRGRLLSPALLQHGHSGHGNHVGLPTLLVPLHFAEGVDLHFLLDGAVLVDHLLQFNLLLL